MSKRSPRPAQRRGAIREAARRAALVPNARLAAAREAAHLSQSALAARAGLKQSLITDLETGRTTHPSHQAAQALAHVLQIDALELFPVALPPPAEAEDAGH